MSFSFPTRLFKPTLDGSEEMDVYDVSARRRYRQKITDVINLSISQDKVIAACQTLTSATTVTMDTSLGNNAKITLGHNVALTLSNLTAGASGKIVVTQGSSNYTLAVTPGPYVENSGDGITAITAGAGSITILEYFYDGSKLFIRVCPDYTKAA
jgi:hypothetical protein